MAKGTKWLNETTDITKNLYNEMKKDTKKVIKEDIEEDGGPSVIRDKIERFEEIMEEISELRREAERLVRQVFFNTVQYERAKYWISALEMAVSNDHEWLGRNMFTMASTLEEMKDYERGDEMDDDEIVEESKYVDDEDEESDLPLIREIVKYFAGKEFTHDDFRFFIKRLHMRTKGNLGFTKEYDINSLFGDMINNYNIIEELRPGRSTQDDDTYIITDSALKTYR